MKASGIGTDVVRPVARSSLVRAFFFELRRQLLFLNSLSFDEASLGYACK